MELPSGINAPAQSYSINWHSIDGGGGTGSGGLYSVSGTVGQPDAGIPMTNDQYSLSGGYWTLRIVQTPGAPLLRIFLTSTNTAVVAWPSPSTGWNLQTATNLGPENWIAPLESVADDGTNRFIIINPPADSRLFRLAKP